MKKIKQILFVVIEKHQISNYTYFESKLQSTGIPYKKVYLPDIKVSSIKYRLKNGLFIFKSLRDYCKKQIGEDINDTLVIYSCAEGFILSNKHIWMPQINNSCEVLMQHGIMPKKIGNLYLRKIINKLLNNVFGFYPYGMGFGGMVADKIIVLGKIYQDLLIRKQRWEKDDIFISGRSLKPNYVISPVSNKDVCLLLLQDISFNRPHLYEKMMSDYKTIVRLLCDYYGKVIVRKHPKMSVSVYNEISAISPFVICSDNSLSEDIKSSGRVYSLYSSALIDACLMGREIVAIKLDGLSNDLYEAFNRTICINQLKEYLSLYSKEDSLAKLNEDLFYDVDNTDTIIRTLIGK